MTGSRRVETVLSVSAGSIGGVSRLLLLLVLVSGCAPGAVTLAAPPSLSAPTVSVAAPAPVVAPVPVTAGTEATVTRIVDGDTINVDIGGQPEKVRILFVDTPEVYGGVECGGREASAFAKATIGVGSRVRLERDPTQGEVDRYQRLLRYVALADGRDYTEVALRAGAGVYVEYDGPGARTEALRAAETEARAAGRGVWAACPVGG